MLIAAVLVPVFTIDSLVPGGVLIKLAEAKGTLAPSATAVSAVR